ncbi:MAG: transaldolase [Acidimicrobiia bacterium]
MSNIHGVAAQGQSIWMDEISRQLLKPDGLAALVDGAGVTGVTSNPTIFANSIVRSTDYDEALGELVGRDADTMEIYTALVTRDIRDACDALKPVWEGKSGADGFVSVEVSPELANETEATIQEARDWWKRVDRPNLLIKVPATPAGIPAVRQLIGEGISVNVTLIFSLHRYQAVMDAYLDGLEAYAQTGGDLSRINSVASFFVSRVDSEVDKRLEKIRSGAAMALRGKAAIANARVAYGLFLETFAGPRWELLSSQGARIQRPLWASTSTKDPAYPDTMYIDQLVVADTVNTVPIKTIDAYQDHGNPHPPVFGHAEISEAKATLESLAAVGIDYDDVVQVLEDEGVEKFIASFRELLNSIDQKRVAIKG